MIKRLFDASLAGIGLVVSAPLWCVIPLAIKIEDGGPVFFPQARVGLDGRVFDALKFRSMRPDAEALTGPVQATENDPRVTRVGRVLRATAMDELPQLVNIFVGDMSFVGPRPLRPGRGRGPRRRAADAAVGDSRLPGTARRPARPDRADTGLRAARHLPHEQVQARPPVPEARQLLARPEADRPVVLDHGPREVGGAGPEGLSAEAARIATQTL